MREDKLHTNEYRCAACGSAVGVKRGEKNGFDIIHCRSCKSLYTSRAAADTSTAHDYDSYYDQENLSAPDFINKRCDEIVAEFAPYRQTARLLDVGFGAGTLMEAAARAGWTVFGVEVSQTAAEHVRKLGFDVFCGELKDAQYPDDYFDVVMASEVLEHVPEPRPLIAEMARIVRPGGLLWATTPHGRGISSKTLGLKWSVISPPEHLQLFSLGSIKALLREAGFRRVRVATHGVNPSEILSNLRGHAKADSDAESSHRVESGYQLNEFMSHSRTRRTLKNMINGMLNLSRLGDSLKIWAEK
jgi:2-polyprenyl-3-methyl-5-hydroxy-6-metoxy-1,4-benzoquinol methylase